MFMVVLLSMWVGASSRQMSANVQKLLIRKVEPVSVVMLNHAIGRAGQNSWWTQIISVVAYRK